jgi:hypothetical protein
MPVPTVTSWYSARDEQLIAADAPRYLVLRFIRSLLPIRTSRSSSRPASRDWICSQTSSALGQKLASRSAPQQVAGKKGKGAKDAGGVTGQENVTNGA